MNQALLILPPFVLVAFWLWMFWDMATNDALPPCVLTFTRNRDPRFDWFVCFVALSIVAAAAYFVSEYWNRD